jgi:hypothetical protein
MKKNKKPSKRLLAVIGVAHATVAALTWRDIRGRSQDEVRGGKRIWRIATSLNSGASVAYWLAGRRRRTRLA